jgi:hypothetical protein
MKCENPNYATKDGCKVFPKDTVNIAKILSVAGAIHKPSGDLKWSLNDGFRAKLEMHTFPRMKLDSTQKKEVLAELDKGIATLYAGRKKGGGQSGGGKGGGTVKIVNNVTAKASSSSKNAQKKNKMKEKLKGLEAENERLKKAAEEEDSDSSDEEDEEDGEDN